MRTVYLFSLIALLAALVGDAAGEGGGGGGAGDIAKSVAKVREPLDAATKSAKAAQDAIAGAKSLSGNAQAVASLAAARLAIQSVTSQQLEVDARFKELAATSVQIERDKNDLQKAKTDLEFRERLFSMGFYASFTAAVIAIFSLLARLPMVRLERKLKLLEIREKELGLRERELKLKTET
jgi:hypothetical protein